MLISVCVATYNAEFCIKNTLESIRTQNYKDFEVIIVDDHSTDNTVNIIREICEADSRFKLFVNCTDPNKKYSDAHNLSYKYASGDYLVRIDNDDLYEPDYLDKIAEIVENYPYLDAFCLAQDFYSYDDNNNIVFETTPAPDSIHTDTSDFDKDPGLYYYKACHFGVNYVCWHNNTSVLKKSFYDSHNLMYVGFGGGDGIFWGSVFCNDAKAKKFLDIKVHKLRRTLNTCDTKEYHTISPLSQYYSASCYLYYFNKNKERYKDNSEINLNVLYNTFNFFKNELIKTGEYDKLADEYKYYEYKYLNQAVDMQEDNNDKYHFVTPKIDVYFHKDPADADKYIVCTCARGENDYIVEYVNHYLNLGFDKIIICDNNPDNSIEEILKDYISAGTVEIFDCRGFDSFQVQFYSMFCSEGNYKWCAYFDADEFLELNCYSNIKDFLNTIKEDSVSFNWLMFGSNGQYHKTEGTVQERFPQPVKPVLMYKENVFYKSILRGGKNRFENVWFNGSHVPECSNPVTYNLGGMYTVQTNGEYQPHTCFPPKYRCGYLKHYYTKSFDEWIKKSSRGWPDGTPTLATANYFSCDNSISVPIEKQIQSLFIDREHLAELPVSIKNILDTYDVIQFNNSDKQVYALYSQFMSILSATTNHTYVFTNEHIDDALFAIFLEYGYVTGNRVIFARNQDEVWRAYLKYSNKSSGTYYILDLR